MSNSPNIHIDVLREVPIGSYGNSQEIPPVTLTDIGRSGTNADRRPRNCSVELSLAFRADLSDFLASSNQPEQQRYQSQE